MTKTLTEQWREGTLACGDYYIKTKGIGIDKIIINYYEEELKQFDGLCDCSVAEVLAPVPSYDEYKELLRHSELSRNLVYEVLVNQKEYNELLDKAKEYKRLQKQLEIATKALERYSKDDYYSEGGGRSVNPYPDIARKALKEMEGVK
jgi:ABC-type oligopeptide transport system substrate-binding subunit